MAVGMGLLSSLHFPITECKCKLGTACIRPCLRKIIRAARSTDHVFLPQFLMSYYDGHLSIHCLLSCLPDVLRTGGGTGLRTWATGLIFLSHSSGQQACKLQNLCFQGLGS